MNLESPIFLLPLIASTAAAQETLFEWTGTAGSDAFGAAVAICGDVDGDGHDDIVVGQPRAGAAPYQKVGAVRVYSGANGAVLLNVSGVESGQYFGSAVAGAGDVDGDGLDDVLIASRPVSGIPLTHVVVLSGTGATLRDFAGLTSDHFGFAVSGAGDLDGDGYDDVLIGSPNWSSGSGRMQAFSGATGTQLLARQGDFAGDRFGAAVSGGGDADGDGIPDIAVGAPQDGTPYGGYARVFRGDSGALWLWKWGDHPNDQFGGALCLERDVDADGHADLIVGAQGFDSGGLVDCGLVQAYSGADGTTLGFWKGDEANDRWGESVSAADVNADGHADIVIGASSDDEGNLNAGLVSVFSGATNFLIYSNHGDLAGDGLGRAVGGGGDVDGDGYDDVVVGAPMYAETLSPGYARVFAGSALFLSIQPGLAQTEGIVEFIIRGGGEGDLAQLFLVSDNDQKLILPVFGLQAFPKAMEADGIHIEAKAGKGLAGHEFGLVVIALIGGKIEISGEQVLKVEKGEK